MINFKRMALPFGILAIFLVTAIIRLNTGVVIEILNLSGAEIANVIVSINNEIQVFPMIASDDAAGIKIGPKGEVAVFEIGYTQDGILRTATVDLRFQSKSNIKYIIVECRKNGRIAIREDASSAHKNLYWSSLFS